MEYSGARHAAVSSSHTHSCQPTLEVSHPPYKILLRLIS